MELVWSNPRNDFTTTERTRQPGDGRYVYALDLIDGAGPRPASGSARRGIGRPSRICSTCSTPSTATRPARSWSDDPLCRRRVGARVRAPRPVVGDGVSLGGLADRIRADIGERVWEGLSPPGGPSDDPRRKLAHREARALLILQKRRTTQRLRDCAMY